jgi:ribonucleoside-diphosphate reductase alpha chain
LDSLSKQTSKLLQYNAPIEDVIKSLKGQKYEPHGFVTEHPYIKYADSISDLLAKILEIEIGDYSSCQIKPEKQLLNNISEVAIKPITVFKHDSKPTGERIYGKTCPTCGSTHMVKNGTCHLCQNCGATTGCS